MNARTQDRLITGFTAVLGGLAVLVHVAKYLNHLARPPKPKPPAYRSNGYRAPFLPK